MDALKFLKKKRRMCENRLCDECPLSNRKNGTDYGCRSFIEKFPEKAITVVEKWSAEHPVKTRQSEFLKMFPNVKLNEYGNVTICPHVVGENYECERESCRKCQEDYWSAEVE